MEILRFMQLAHPYEMIMLEILQLLPYVTLR